MIISVDLSLVHFGNYVCEIFSYNLLLNTLLPAMQYHLLVVRRVLVAPLNVREVTTYVLSVVSLLITEY